MVRVRPGERRRGRRPDRGRPRPRRSTVGEGSVWVARCLATAACTGSRRERARAGASTSAAPRSRPRSSSARNKVLGEARRQTPHQGRPRGRRHGDGRRPARRRRAGRGRAGDAGRGRRRLPRRRGREDRRRHAARATCPAGRAPSRSPTWLSEELGAPVRVGNDVQVAVEAEYHLGAGKPYKTRCVGVFWGTGVGGGLILDGKPWLGRGAAGEIGHVVVKRGGPRCSAGHPGCMEAYAGRGHRWRPRRGARSPSGREDEAVQDRWRSTSATGSPAASGSAPCTARGRAGPGADEPRRARRSAAGIASIVNLLDPEAVILGGGMGVRFARAATCRKIKAAHGRVPVRPRGPARVRRRRARRPRRRDRRGPAGRAPRPPSDPRRRRVLARAASPPSNSISRITFAGAPAAITPGGDVLGHDRVRADHASARRS